MELPQLTAQDVITHVEEGYKGNQAALTSLACREVLVGLGHDQAIADEVSDGRGMVLSTVVESVVFSELPHSEKVVALSGIAVAIESGSREVSGRRFVLGELKDLWNLTFHNSIFENTHLQWPTPIYELRVDVARATPRPSRSERRIKRFMESGFAAMMWENVEQFFAYNEELQRHQEAYETALTEIAAT